MRVPLGMHFIRGTNVLIDNHAPLGAPDMTRTYGGRTSQYELTPELQALLRSGLASLD